MTSLVQRDHINTNNITYFYIIQLFHNYCISTNSEPNITNIITYFATIHLQLFHKCYNYTNSKPNITNNNTYFPTPSPTSLIISHTFQLLHKYYISTNPSPTSLTTPHTSLSSSNFFINITVMQIPSPTTLIILHTFLLLTFHKCYNSANSEPYSANNITYCYLVPTPS